MSEPFTGEIRLFGGNFAPEGWQNCDGTLLSISAYNELFMLIGTTYGGDGQTTFAVPDLRGRVPIGQGTGNGLSPYTFGTSGGQETVTLTTNQLPSHTHAAAAAATGQVASPQGAIFASAQSDQAGVRIYSTNATTTALAPQSITPAGGSQPHDNIQPFQVIRYIICVYGIFPSQQSRRLQRR